MTSVLSGCSAECFCSSSQYYSDWGGFCRLSDEPIQMSKCTVYHVGMALWRTGRLSKCRRRVFVWWLAYLFTRYYL